MPVTKKQLEALQPLLEGSGPSDSGEWNMYCPYHGDSKRSASLHVEKAVWNCHGCGQAGSASALIKDKENWVLSEIAQGHAGRGGKTRKMRMPSEGAVAGWVEALKADAGALAEFSQRRGLKRKTIFDYEIGWDSSKNAYTIPVRNLDGDLLNVRWYQLDPSEERRKFWGVTGAESALLYPVEQLASDALVICEGELDALACIQAGIPAVTRTGAADVWRPNWSPLFAGKRVFVCHDMDTKGQHANEVISNAIRGHAASVTVVKLPYEVTKKHGKDLTDFFKDGNTRADFLELIRSGRKVRGAMQNEDQSDDKEEPTEVKVGVMDSFDASLVHKPLVMNVTVTGKKIPSYLVPSSVTFSCDQSMEQKCVDCALGIKGGTMTVNILPSDPVILSMLDVPADKVVGAVFARSGIKKCVRLEGAEDGWQTVEEIYVRPSIEDSDRSPDFTHRKVISLSHDLQSNQTVRLTGTIRPNPFTQANEFQAWKVERPPSTMDTYKVTKVGLELMQLFQDKKNDPLARCEEIADDLSAGVTLIRGRTDMHVFMDLVFHSALQFKFGAEPTGRGWLDAMIVGDTRTGKSEAAMKLIDFYGAGEMVSCESASFAGVVGGLDRIGDSRWVVKWGSIPINDSRAVVLDEVTGLTPEQIAQMSSIRSSGVAELTKIMSEKANARTRLLWLANARDAPNGMNTYTFGVQAIAPIIGNQEDIARFDMVMGVFSNEVDADTINVVHHEDTETQIPREAYRELLMWAWTRKDTDIKWPAKSVNAVLKAAIKMGEDYEQDPPLVQGANVRFKIARLATAVAIRTFSSPDGAKVIVTPAHVEAACDFLNRIYNNPQFGYAHASVQKQADSAATLENMDEIMAYINSVRNGGLIRFFKQYSKFNKGQIMMSMNVSNEEAQSMFAKMYDLRAISWSGKEWILLNPEIVSKIRGL